MDLVGVHHICECSLLLRNAIEQHVSGLDPTGDLCLENACAQLKYVGRFRTTVLALLNVADLIHVIVSILSVRCMFSHLLRYGTVSPLALNDVKDCENLSGRSHSSLENLLARAEGILYIPAPCDTGCATQRGCGT
jgi:hypothetical protein